MSGWEGACVRLCSDYTKDTRETAKNLISYDSQFKFHEIITSFLVVIFIPFLSPHESKEVEEVNMVAKVTNLLEEL